MEIAVIGIGYVGLPLAIEFGKKFKTFGYDSSREKIISYQQNIDPNGEISNNEIQSSKKLEFTFDPSKIKNADFFVVSVPTPVNSDNIPDLSYIINASKTIALNLKKGSTIIYEPTVFPGATEEICVPILEKYSGLIWKRDFNVGYSPERINPGDKTRSIRDIIKVVSGDTNQTLESIANLYSSIISAGVYKASSIKVAEAAKVIENTQRDLNIALVNELSIIFNKIGIDTQKVLDAACTKWNFIPFKPGLVGGHCIGVDPYYLTYKANLLGYNPKVILAGRETNDNMPNYISSELFKLMKSLNFNIKKSKITILGLTFKENCIDIRNSKVVEMILNLKEKVSNIRLHDPIANTDEALKNYNLSLTLWDDLDESDVIIAAVSHDFYLNKPVDEILQKLKNGGIFVDIKSAYPETEILERGYKLWRL